LILRTLPAGLLYSLRTITMNRIHTLACLCFVSFGFSLAARALPSEPPSIAEAELVRRTQQLYDAVAPGNQAPWKAFYADDAMVYDEKGRSMDKKALLADLDPMPAGYSGTIKVVHPHTLFAPGVAVLAYECEETETIFGQELHAHYHSVDTWLYRNGAWQIAASQTMRFYDEALIQNQNVDLTQSLPPVWDRVDFDPQLPLSRRDRRFGLLQELDRLAVVRPGRDFGEMAGLLRQLNV
jgi:Domain of unknown function (DUF4440)